MSSWGDDSDNEDMVALVDVLQVLGVEPVCALRFATSMAHNRRPPATVSELYGRGSVVDMANAHARSLNISGLDALDLRTLKPDGSPWDLRRPEDRAEAERLQDGLNPDWLIGSPPCVGDYQFNWSKNFHNMDPARV